MLFGVCIEGEYDLINHVYCNTVIHLSKRINFCSVYMNKTLYGYTPNENSSLDLDHSDTHNHNIETKRCKVNNDSANLFVALPFRSYWCKGHEETPY